MPAQLTVEVYLIFSRWNTTQSREPINYKCMPKNVDEYYKHKIEQKLPDKKRVHCVITFIQSSIIGKAIYEVRSQDNITLWGIETGIQQKKCAFGVLAIFFFLISMRVSQTWLFLFVFCASIKITKWKERKGNTKLDGFTS